MFSRLSLSAGVLGTCLALASVAAAQEPKVGEKAKEIELKNLAGESWKLSERIARGPVVVVVLRGFPGYQCPICSQQLNDLLKSGEAFTDKQTRVLLVYPGPADGLTDKAKDFIGTRKLPANFTMVTDPDYKMITAWGLRWSQAQETSYPSTFVLDKTGVIQYAKVSKTHEGRADAASILAALDKLK